jgi:glycine/D-amino acid oxidase-like deaminating enzyme
MVRSMTEVVIVGGGIAGVTAAAALAERGIGVRLFEQGGLASAASGENTGTLLQQTEPEVAAMLRETVAIYKELADGPVDFGFAGHDELLLARDESQLERAHAKAQAFATAGIRAESMTAEELALAYPYLAPAAGGVLVADTYALEPEATVHAFAARARHAGAEITTHCRVVQVHPGRGVLTDGGAVRADIVIVATGPWLADLLPTAPVQGGRGWLLRTEPLPFQLECMIEELSWPDQDVLGAVGAPRRLADLAHGRTDPPLADAVFLCPQRDGGALVGASMTLSLDAVPEGADMPSRLASRAVAAAPGLADVGVRRAWSGLRPTAPDGLPVVGRVPGADGLLVHGGHTSLGMQAAPATAARLADEICGQPVPDWYRTLDPGRFSTFRPVLPRTPPEEQWQL